ncbi:hypothetical protein [Actinokineospora sp. NBRC 105648]|uniref:hypothetical protein n=1 Tax=Actinokineospora sp. NBRC 105648 TaxID=3032206 RepID=UPI0024A3BB0E|nr:hypothetical protein [Actinokineospora sp. NBRC 105648]GLZ42736.1 hypothetical protein Acsp05_63600 [Actinokineospora sp. NBRC 105648]
MPEPCTHSPPVSPHGGDGYLLSRVPQSLTEVLLSGQYRDGAWPEGVPTLIEDLRDLIGCAHRLIASVAEGSPLRDHKAVDGIDSTAYRVVEACRWLQVHQTIPTT